MRIKSLTTAFALAAAWGVQAHAGVDPLTQIQPPSNEWTYDGSNPDQIIEVPSFTVPATGVIDYINSVIPLEFGLRPCSSFPATSACCTICCLMLWPMMAKTKA